MGDKYAGWTEVPADEYAGWTEEQPQSAAPAEKPSRLARAAAAIRAAPGAAWRMGMKGGELYGQALAHPIDTAKQLTDFSPEGLGGSVVRGAGRGMSAGFIDELDGVVGLLGEAGKQQSDLIAGKPREIDMGASYRASRDQRRKDDDTSQAANPNAFTAAQIGGAAVMPMAKAGVAGRLAQGAGYGAAYGLGGSTADMTKGETGPALMDMGEGAAVGLGTAAAIEPVAALGRYGVSLKAQGKAGQIDKVSKAATKDFASERGGLGSDSRGTLTKLKTAQDVIASPLAPPEMKAQAQAFLDSELGKQTQLTAWRNTLDDLPSQMGQMGERRAAMEAAAAAAEPAAVEATAMSQLGESVVKKEVLPRLDRLVGNKALSMVGQFGGAPITTTKNLLKNPHMQYRTGQVAEAVGGPAAAAGQSVQPGGSQLLEDYLRPMDDEERKKQGAAWFTGRSADEPQQR